MLPDRYTALVYIAALSLALNVLVVAVVGAFLYVAIDFTKHEVQRVSDGALYILEEEVRFHTASFTHTPKRGAAKRQTTPKPRSRAEHAIAGSEITVTEQACCVD